MYNEGDRSRFGGDYYTACQPVGKLEDIVGLNQTNIGDKTWRGLHIGANENQGWIYFTPDESKQFVIGEARFANSIEETYTGGASTIKDIKVYQFSRSFQTIRESYNFTITPSDFTQAGGLGTHFFANPAFWTDDYLNGAFIQTATINKAAIIGGLSASNIEAGRIEVKVEVGGDAKILLDGDNSRIIISE